MKDAKVRIRNTTGYPAETVVELVGADGEVRDLTKEALIYHPIHIVADEDGVFALLRVPVESFDMVARPRLETVDETAQDSEDRSLGRRIRRLLKKPVSLKLDRSV